MSYDLAVWEGQRPRDNQAALAVYIQLMDGLERLGGSPQPATPAIAAYVRALLGRWPDTTEEAGQDSPCFDPQRGCLRPFNETDGPPADVSFPSITCAACGHLIDVDEPRAQTFRSEQRPVHLACLDK